ncbi:MAG: SDR family NAD(P)-dependent oxidoreductase [Phenylobacterium sp.]
MGRFEGKVAVITGGASGIGAAAARRFHAEGASVLLADLNAEAGAALAAELGDGRARFRRVDVAVWPEVDALVADAVQAFGGLDILFNNAGIGSFSNVADLAVEDWRRVIDVDLSSVFYGCKAAIPALRARGGGAIINTASISGLAGDFAFAAYNAAKAGVINLTRSVAIDPRGRIANGGITATGSRPPGTRRAGVFQTACRKSPLRMASAIAVESFSNCRAISRNCGDKSSAP